MPACPIDPVPLLLQALYDERRARVEAEREAEELRERLYQLTHQEAECRT